ncbi:hypothetical protein [Sorangium sp. So ce513]|uniref:hypothetical protein n=1 Tax=Sorangium sp. So ce513 TaxID=3133315 RepID=UPI003F622E33
MNRSKEQKSEPSRCQRRRDLVLFSAFLAPLAVYFGSIDVIGVLDERRTASSPVGMELYTRAIARRGIHDGETLKDASVVIPPRGPDKVNLQIQFKTS